MPRKIAETEGAGKPPSRVPARLVWGAFILLVFVIIVIYEMRQQLEQPQPSPGAADQSAEPAPEPSETVARATQRLVEYYRSHDLPKGWRIAGIEPSGDAAVTAAIVYSPSLQDSRYGQPAPAEDLVETLFCPTETAIWRDFPTIAVGVELSDKTGALSTFTCLPQAGTP